MNIKPLFLSVFTSSVFILGNAAASLKVSAEPSHKNIEKLNENSPSVEQASSNVLAKFEKQLEQARGQVVYLDFWASWCIPCRKSFPWMNELQKKYQTNGLKVIAINLDADVTNAQQFLTEIPAMFDVIYDPNGDIAKKFKLKGMPNSFLIDRSGKMVSAHVGFNNEKQNSYEEEIITLLAEK